MMRLGKKPATAPRVKALVDLLRPLRLPPVPAYTNRAYRVRNWGMDGNDTVGDCVEAGGCHAVDLWTAVAGAPRVATTADALSMYGDFGYIVGDPSTDNGTNMQDFLTRWSQQGYQIGGQKDQIAGFQSISPTDVIEIKEAVAHLGCAIVGLALPTAYETMTNPGAPFDIPVGQSLSGDWAYGSAGGHCVLIADYDQEGFTVVTWGMLKRMTPRFWLAYADEAYAVLSRDFASAAIPDEAWAQLEADMADLRSAAVG